MNFLIKRKLHRIPRGFEFRFWRIDRRDHHAPASIDDVLNETQRMAFLFLGLSKKMLRQLRKRLRREMRCDCVILQFCTELVPDLFVDGIDNFLASEHMNLFDGFIILLAQCRLALKSTYLNKVALLGVSEKRGFNSGDVLLTRGFPRARPAARAGLTIYVARLSSARPLTASRVPPRRASSKHAARKCKSPTEINPAGFLVLATSYSRTAYRRTTIGAAAFHCRVRNGNGWGHCAIITRSLLRRSEQTSGDVIRDSLNRYIGRLSGSRFSYYDSRFSFQRTAASLISTYRLSDSAVVDRRYSDNFV